MVYLLTLQAPPIGRTRPVWAKASECAISLRGRDFFIVVSHAINSVYKVYERIDLSEDYTIKLKVFPLQLKRFGLVLRKSVCFFAENICTYVCLEKFVKKFREAKNS